MMTVICFDSDTREIRIISEGSLLDETHIKLAIPAEEIAQILDEDEALSNGGWQ